MMNPKYTLLLLFFFVLGTSSQLFGQFGNRPLELVQQKKQEGNEFIVSPVFKSLDSPKSLPELEREKAAHRIVDIDHELLNRIVVQKPTSISVPLKIDGQQLELLLVQVNPFADDFQVTESATERAVEVELGVHYRGVIASDKTSITGMSFFPQEIIGMVSSSALGNLVIGKLEGAEWTKGEHVIYDDANILDNFELDCATPDDGKVYRQDELEFDESRAPGDCVRFYFEVDDDITSNKGGINNTTAFVTGMYNQVATIYSNENINTVISEIFIWTTNSPYSSSSSSGMLNQFQGFRTNWNGDLAQLLSYQASGGIAAGFNGICNPNRAASMSFSSINTSYNNFPNYSWNIMVISHEFGHIFGSRHTHACVWNGNGTAIDGCSGSTEGSCPLPGNPSQGGTIMSYCHLQNVGINFNEGFGPQPGNVIRNEVANGNCLVACGPPTCDDGIQNGDEEGVDCGGSDCPACPTCDDGIQNGDEEGVDCGGSDCAPCPCFANNVTLTIQLDNYPEETSWDIRDANGNVVANGGTYGNFADGATVVENICLPDGCFDFNIYDSYGDGICCGYGNGSYTLTKDADGSVLASGGSFGSSETTNFCVILDDEPEPDCINLTLTILFDQSPEDISWDIIDEQGNTIYAEGPYDSDLNGEVILEYICLPDGCYTFGIYDDGNNGLCCRFGQGQYILSYSSNGSIIASGSSFGSSDIEAFCLNDTPADPTCDDGIQNGDEEGVDCGGPDCPACPSCDDGIQNGDEEGVDCGGPDCPACPSCDDGIQNGDEEGVDCGGPDCPACPTCDDGIQNGDEEGVDCGGSDCEPCDVDGCATFVDEDFEGGLGIWNDGGSDCRRAAIDAPYAYSGTYCVRLRDNTSSSTITTDPINLSGYSQLTVSFTYITRSMDSSEDFWLQISTGGGYTTVASWVHNVDFENEERYFETITINGPFSANTRVRFRCDASNNSDFVYLDDIKIEACANSVLANQPTQTNKSEQMVIKAGLKNVNVFPNPASYELNVDFDSQLEGPVQFVVMDLNGKLISREQFMAVAGQQQKKVNTSNLSNGVYFLHIVTANERITRKFVVAGN